MAKARGSRAPCAATYEKAGTILPKFKLKMEQTDFEKVLDEAKEIYESPTAIWTIQGNDNPVKVLEAKHRVM